VAVSVDEPRGPAEQVQRTGWRSHWRQHRLDAGYGLIAASLSSLGAVAVLRLWDADLGVPFAGSGDALFFQMLVKAALERGWILTNPDLGAPFGQELHDYPVAGADALHVLVVKALGLLFSSPAAVLNAYYLLSFPLSALSAFVVLRWLRVSAAVAVAAAVLFALAPYHFLRGESHFFLALYYTVPLGAYLVLAISLGTPLFSQRIGRASPLLRFATVRTFITLAICVAVALSDLYYVAFTALLVVAATLISFVARRQRTTLVTGAVVTMALIAALGIELSPNLLYRAEHGTNRVALGRVPSESEAFSLNLAQLVMPVPGHRVDGLASIRQRYANATNAGREPAPIGLLAALGFVWLLVVALAAGVGAAGHLTRDVRQRALATANLTAFLIGTTGGVSAVIAYGISPQLRTWSRLSIFIAFFALAALALLADAAVARLAPRGGRASLLVVGALAVVVFLGVLEQTSRSFAPPYTEVAAEYRSDAAFVQRIEDTVVAGASIFQLPYARFPDALEYGGLRDYDALRGYVHSRDLRWSFGAMKGRPEDWQAETSNLPPSVVVAMASAAGFDGIYLDRFGYADNGTTVEGELKRILKVPALVSGNERLTFFDMRPYNRELRRAHTASQLQAVKNVTLNPLQTVWPAHDFHPEWRDGAESSRWAVQPDSRLRVINPSAGPRSVVLIATLERTGGDQARVTMTYPGGEAQSVQVQPTGTPLLRTLHFPPGESSIEIATTGFPLPEGGGREGFGLVKVINLQLIPVEVLRLLPPEVRRFIRAGEP
jgi:hypothetical protein